jgi:hypothetical protein
MCTAKLEKDCPNSGQRPLGMVLCTWNEECQESWDFLVSYMSTGVNSVLINNIQNTNKGGTRND